MLADAIVEPLALGGAMAEGLLPMPASYTALLWPLEDAMARLRAEVKNLHLPGCPDPNAEKYQALSLAVEKLPPVEQLLAQWLPDAAGRCLVLCEDDAAAAQTAEQAGKLFGAGTHIYKDAESFAADEAASCFHIRCVFLCLFYHKVPTRTSYHPVIFCAIFYAKLLFFTDLPVHHALPPESHQ